MSQDKVTDLFTNGVPKLIILEGPDGAGKSTLGKELLEHLEAHGVKAVFHHFDEFKNISHTSFLFAKKMKQLAFNYECVILDRCWISEPIYSKSFEKRNRISNHEYRMLDRLALTYNALVVLCLPDLDHCLKTFSQRSETEYLDNQEQLIKVYKLYKAMLYKEAVVDQGTNQYSTSLPLISYNFKNTSIERLAIRINSFTRRSFIKSHTTDFGVGSRHVGTPFLVVGKLYRDRKYNWFTDFAETINYDIAAINDSLDKHQIYEEDLAWLNVMVCNQPLDKLHEFIKTLDPQYVIATDEHTLHHMQERYKIDCLFSPLPSLAQVNEDLSMGMTIKKVAK